MGDSTDHARYARTPATTLPSTPAPRHRGSIAARRADRPAGAGAGLRPSARAEPEVVPAGLAAYLQDPDAGPEPLTGVRL